MSETDFRVAALQLKVGALERKLDFVLAHLGVQYSESPLDAAQSEAAAALRSGNKIEAIAAYRRVTGVGLKEAKEAVEALEAKLIGR